MMQIPAPVVCDPKGDGNPLVLVADQSLVPNVYHWPTDKGNAPPGLQSEILALDGKTGIVKWSWRGEAATPNLSQGPLESEHEGWRDASPQIARTPAGPVIVVSAFDESLGTPVGAKTNSPRPAARNGSYVATLDLRGKPLQKTYNERGGPPAAPSAGLGPRSAGRRTR